MGHLVELEDMWGADVEDAEEAIRFLPLLDSICAEVADRLRAMDALGYDSDRTYAVRSEVAIHRAAFESALEELRALGCQVSETDPLTILVTEEKGMPPRCLVWETENPALHG